MLYEYFKEIRQLLSVIEKEEGARIREAAERIADSLERDGLLYVFGCGHSHLLAGELFYRAGGLAPVYPVFVEELMLHEGAVRSSELEKQAGYAEKCLSGLPIGKHDVMLVASTSGRNPVPIDVALLAREKGAFVIVLTALDYAGKQASRHASGKHLSEVADLCLNNHVQVGDGMLQYEQLPFPVASGSTVAGAVMLNSLIAEVIEILLQRGVETPVYQSGNVDGGAAYNQALIERYKNRIPFL